MKISLPENYFYKDVADEQDGILYIHRFNSFDNLMYDITYSLYDNIECYYCGKKLTRKKSTIDHIVPRDLGGVSIPDNLCISCSDCNSQKGSLLKDEFLYYLSLSKESDRKEFIQKQIEYNEKVRKKSCPLLPKEWLTKQSIDDINPCFFSESSINGKTYKKVEDFYKKYKRLRRPVVVDRNYNLLDGFNTYLFARNNYLFIISAVVLENVEIDFKLI